MMKSTILLLFCGALGTVTAAPFENVTAAMKLTGQSEQSAAWGDFDNDGFVDLFSSAIFRNEGGESFKNVAALPPHVSVADYNGDGFLDVAGVGEAIPTITLLSYNGETGKWDDNSAAFEKVPTYRPYSSFWGDFNGDGMLDYYITGMTAGTPFEGHPTPDYIYFAEKAEDGSVVYKITWTSPGGACTRGASPCDFDRDGDIDVMTSGYWMTTDFFWRNDGKGTFDDAGGAMGIPHRHGHGIGPAWGDFDNDGWIDLYISNFSHPGNPPPAFARNNEGNNFENKGAGGIGWVESQGCPAAGDYDNDGDLDLFLTALYTPRGRLMRNDGGWNFTDVTGEAGLAGIGPGYQAAWGDYNNDGYLDIIAHGKLFKNPGGDNHWLKVKLTASDGKINASAVGAQVRIVVPEIGTLTRQVETGTGQGNQNELTMHFGLGTYSGPLTLEIFWPDKATQSVKVDSVDKLVRVDRK